MLDKAVEDRILKSLNFQEGDRVPIWELIDNYGIYKYFAGDEEDYTRGMVKVFHGLGIDMCRGLAGSYAPSDEGRTIGSHVIMGSTLWQTEFPIKSLEDLKKYEPPRVTPEHADNWVAHCRQMQELFAPYTMYVPVGGCGFHETYGLMGLELFSFAIYYARDNIERILWIINENNTQYTKAAAEHNLCPIHCIGDDVAYKNAIMFPPDFMRETFIECLRRTIEPLKKAGIKTIFHSDGYVMPIMDDMIAAGIDGLNPIEPIAGMDIGHMKRQYGEKLVLVGNVDCSQMLPLGTREEVIEATKTCIREASPGGGHFIGSSSEIVPATPVENILAFYETVHEYGKYPIAI